MTETIPQMRSRHRKEILDKLAEANTWGVPQSVAAKALGMSTTGFNNLLRRSGVEWAHPRIWRRSDLLPSKPFEVPKS